MLVGFSFPGAGGGNGTGSGNGSTVDEAHRTFPAFAEAWDQAWNRVAAQVGLSVAGLSPERAVEALAEGRAFAEQVALFALAARSGLRPRAALVSGVGAVAAACAAGRWQVEDAVTVLAARHAADPDAFARAVAGLPWGFRPSRCSTPPPASR